MEEFQCSPSCLFNTEEDSDDPVEFLTEVRVLCLICGTNTEIDNIVKQEIDQFEEDTGNNQDYQLGLDGGSVNHDVFHWFLKWFRVDIVKKGKQKKRFIDKGWDGEGGDIIRFCGNCKMELMSILDLQKQLDNLEQRFKNGLMEVKGKMERFEEAFKSSGLYQNDSRYEMVRSQILKCETENLGHCSQIDNQSSLIELPAHPSSKRRSSRIKTNTNVSKFITMTQAVTNDAEGSVDRVPFIMLSSENNGITGLHPNLNLPEMSINSSSDILAPANKLPTKRAKIMARNKSSNYKPSKLVGEMFLKNFCRRKPVNIPKKIVEENSSSPSSRRKSSRIKPHIHVNKSGSSTSAVIDEIDRPVSKASSSDKTNNEQHSIPDVSEMNPDNSSEVLVYAKKSKPTKLFQIEDSGPATEEAMKRKTNQKESVVEKVNRRTSPRIAKIPKTVHASAMEVDRAEDVEDDKEDTNKNSKCNGQNIMRYKVDPSTNMITYGPIKFSILSDNTRKISCTSCNIITSNSQPSMYAHVIKHHTKKFWCPQCPFRGQNKHALDVHTKGVHHGLPVWKRYKCKICGKPISNRKQHEWTHMSKEEQDEMRRNEPERMPEWVDRTFRCEECGKCFESQKQVKFHNEKEHDAQKPETQKQPCPECGKMFAKLRDHKKYYHTNAARFVCIEQGCGKRFRNLSNLTRHKNGVHKGKPWKCTKCFREFSRKPCFQKHMDLHLGIRPFKCEVEGCISAFVREADLKQHQKNFHAEGSRPMGKCHGAAPLTLKGVLKPVTWKCPRCTRKFSKQYLFKNHMNLHLGIRPWKCEVQGCEMAFVTKEILKAHFERYHSGGCKPSRKSYTRRPNGFKFQPTKKSKTE